MWELLVGVGKAVAGPPFRWWLAERRSREERSRELSELIQTRFPRPFDHRKVERELQGIVDAVAQRLEPLCEHEFRDLEDNEKRAALSAVLETFTSVDLSDEALFQADADPVKLARDLRATLPDVPERRLLSASASRFYNLVLDESCDCYARIVVQLDSFRPRATAELLSRTSGLAEQVNQVLERLPRRSLDAPSGSDHDEEFRARYLAQVSETLDVAEVFGVDVRQYQPRTTLSVAYVSLSVAAGRRGGHAHAVRKERSAVEPGGLRFDDHDPRAERAETARVRVEGALAQGTRTLIRGEAGSGKSTVLRWLAVTAARGGFEGPLTEWNGCVPFLVKLRSFAEIHMPKPSELLDGGETMALSGVMPDGWAERQLRSGRALLLVDGVDELPAPRRRKVREWLRGLVAAYPHARMVVTSRPPAAAADWLASEGFADATLERMSPADVRAFIHNWHEAVREAGNLPCEPTQLPRYENALLGRLEANAHLRGLATTPLLCAMLCALNLDRNTHLPRDRMEIYQAALGMLLDRRDTERGVPSAQDVDISVRDKLHLLREIAWWLSLNSRSELPTGVALERVPRELTTMPQVAAEPEAVLGHLLHRSGVIREPVAGRVDFVHRTFQEYLAAKYAADEEHGGLLIEKAHLDQWREVVVMAAGHGNERLRRELVSGLLDRAEDEPRHHRALRLLAAACLETVPSLGPEVLTRVEAAVDMLLPPRNAQEAWSLAQAGSPLLRRLPRDLSGLSKAQAAATVRTAALVGGPEALEVLAEHAPDPRARVQRALAEVWEYFDPDEYATRVLRDAPLVEGKVFLHNRRLLPATRHLNNLCDLRVDLEGYSVAA